jgi:hypothetical protein
VEADVREEVLMGLVYRARTDPEFKHKAKNDLEGTLIREYQYNLTQAELDLCGQFRGIVADMTEEQLDQELARRADPVTDYRYQDDV